MPSGNKKLAATEFGWNSDDEGTKPGIGRTAQAAYLVRAIMILNRWGADQAVPYNILDDSSNGLYYSNGLFDANDGNVDEKKESYYAIKRIKQMIGNKKYIPITQATGTNLPEIENDNGLYAYFLGEGNEATHLVMWRAENFSNIEGVNKNFTNNDLNIDAAENLNSNATASYTLPVNILNLIDVNTSLKAAYLDGRKSVKLIEVNEVINGNMARISAIPIVVPLQNATCFDSDGDGICDSEDNCPEVANSDQSQIPCIDNDGDGYYAFEDCDDNDSNVPNSPGSSCDDGSDDTRFDKYQQDGCTCSGDDSACAFVDIEVIDGVVRLSNIASTVESIQYRGANTNYDRIDVCDGDCQSEEEVYNLTPGKYTFKVRQEGSDYCEIDYIVIVPCVEDNDGDGVCAFEDCDDNNPEFPKEKGTSCDDGNPDTIFDEIQDDGCECAGVESCGIDFSLSEGSITINGLIPDGSLIKITLEGQEIWSCSPYSGGTPCNETETVSGLIEGSEYNLQVNNPDCGTNIPFTVIGNCTDQDGDGVCSGEDCDDNNASLPTTPGTLCDDGNPTTTNDIIQNDGCSCAGIPIGCTDSDGDGVCLEEDCDDNDPNVPTIPGTTCNDGDPNVSPHLTP